MSGINCCKGCVPPKRYPGCGAKCAEYIRQKKELEEEKAARLERDAGRVDAYRMHKKAVVKALRRRGEK